MQFYYLSILLGPGGKVLTESTPDRQATMFMILNVTLVALYVIESTLN